MVVFVRRPFRLVANLLAHKIFAGCRMRDKKTDCLQKEGTDEVDDPLLNPAHVLVGSHGENEDLANAFVDWLVDSDGGQQIIENFASKDGTVLYSSAPRASEKAADQIASKL